MVSLREQALRLIGLRGVFAVGGAPTREVALSGGLRVELARDLFLDVEEVVLPDDVLGIAGPTVPRQALPPVCALVTEPSLRVVRGWTEGAAALVWSTGGSWRLRVGDAPSVALEVGDQIRVGDEVLEAVAVPLASAGQRATRARGAIDAPLRVVAHFDTGERWFHRHSVGGGLERTGDGHPRRESRGSPRRRSLVDTTGARSLRRHRKEL